MTARSISFTDADTAPKKKKPKQGHWVRRWEVESMTEVGKLYAISLSATGTWGCSCPAWKFHKAPKLDCKHILFVQASPRLDWPQKVTLPVVPVGEQFIIRRAISFED